MLGCVSPEELNRICQRKYLRGVKLEPVGPRGAANTQKRTPDMRTGTCCRRNSLFLNNKKTQTSPRQCGSPLTKEIKSLQYSGMTKLLHLAHWKAPRNFPNPSAACRNQMPAASFVKANRRRSQAGDFQFSLLRASCFALLRRT
jgi:hypothetical protein